MRGALCLVLGACGRLGFDAAPVGDGGGAPDSRDARDASSPDAVPVTTGTWGPPMLVEAPINTVGEQEPTFTADQLTLVFRRGDGDLFEANRASVSDPWGEPRELTELNTTFFDLAAGISGDGLTLYFSSDRPGGQGQYDIWVSTRPTRTSSWGAAIDLPTTINTAAAEVGPMLTPDGLLLFSSDRSGQSWLYQATGTPPAIWSAPMMIYGSTGIDDASPRIYAGGLGLVFYSNGGGGNIDLWQGTRTSTADAFGTTGNIPELSTGDVDWDPWVSDDGHFIMWGSDRSGDQLIWQATR